MSYYQLKDHLSIEEILDYLEKDELLEYQMPQIDNPEILMDELSKRFEASRRAMGLANKLSGPSKKKHLSRILGIMNKLRAGLRYLEKNIEREMELYRDTEDLLHRRRKEVQSRLGFTGDKSDLEGL